MTTLSDGDWQRVEQAYRETREPVAQIARRFAVSPSTIQRRRRLENWPPRGEVAADDTATNDTAALDTAPAGMPAGRTGARPAPGPSDTTPDLPSAGRDELIQRFYNLINIKLGQMEEDMVRPKDRTPADNERDARALGTLIRNFEKVFGLEQGEVGDGANARRRGKRERDEQAEAEALRRELAERLVRIRNANRGAGGRADERAS